MGLDAERGRGVRGPVQERIELSLDPDWKLGTECPDALHSSLMNSRMAASFL